MPKKREGMTQIPVEMPDEIVVAIKGAAKADDIAVVAWITRLCARKLKIQYTPPKRGPKKVVAK